MIRLAVLTQYMSYTCGNTGHYIKLCQLTYSRAHRSVYTKRKRLFHRTRWLCSSRILIPLITLCGELSNSMFKLTITYFFTAEELKRMIIISGKHFHNVS